MRSLLAALGLAAALIAAPASAQDFSGPNLDEQRAAMQRLAPLVGRWQGEAQVTSPRAMTVYQTEQVEIALDGLIMIVRGAGHANADRAGDPVFQAFAVLSYDDRRDIYEFRTYVYGHATTATGEFLSDNAFRWSVDPPGPFALRYTITFDATTWREIGETTQDDGATWTQTIALDLRKLP